VFGHFHGDKDIFSLKVGNCPEIKVPYCSSSGLPIAEAQCGPTPEPTAHLSVLDDENTNLAPGEKLLLEWHFRFGHLNFASVQHLLRYVPSIATKYALATKADHPKRHVCQLTKQSRHSRQSTKQIVLPGRDGALKDGHLVPGAAVSVDHFESRLRGRTFDSYGKVSSATYK
jgi:hypothetical protein